MNSYKHNAVVFLSKIFYFICSIQDDGIKYILVLSWPSGIILIMSEYIVLMYIYA